MEESFDLSEVSDIVRNDSDGHRLAQYLKKKSGKGKLTRRIYESADNRLSIEVHLRKANEKDKTNIIEQDDPIENNPQNEAAEIIQPPANETNKEKQASPLRLSGRSPLASYMKRTPHGTDLLRQSALNRLSHQVSGRRCLLNIFNNNISESSAGVEFSPDFASTPLNTIPAIQNEPKDAEAIPSKRTSEVQPTPHRHTIEKRNSKAKTLLTPLGQDNSNKENNGSSNSDDTSRGKEHKKSPKRRTSKDIQQNQLRKEVSVSRILVTPTKIRNKSGLEVHIVHNSAQAPSIQISCKEPEVSLSSLRPDTTAQPSPADQPMPPNDKEHTIINRNNVEASASKNVMENENENENGNENENENEPITNGGGTFVLQPPIVNTSDAITDDEEPDQTEIIPNKIASSDETTYNKKLNHSFRTKKLRKRKLRNMKSVQQTNKEHHTPTISKRRKRTLTLNKAPRTPINGEMFADELKMHLAGISNREVLDLRRRKSGSLGKTKPLSLANSKKQHLEKQRNKKNSTRSVLEEIDQQVTQCRENNEITIENRMEKEIETEVLTQNISAVNVNNFEMEVLEGEISDDRVSFVTKTSNTNNVQRKLKKTSSSEICGSYIEVKKNLTVTKKKINDSKRSLFSLKSTLTNQVSPDSSVVDIVPPPLMFRSSTPRKNLRSRIHNTSPIQTDSYTVNSHPQSPQPSSPQSLPRSQSSLPDTQSQPSTSPQPLSTTPSPPSTSPSSPPTSLPQQSISRSTPQTSPPPPPPSPAASISVIREKINESESNSKSDKNQDGVFKKPKNRAPKKKVVKVIEEKKSQPEEDPQPDEASLRRSKRVRKEVPKSLFWIMWEENLMKSIEDSKRRNNMSKISSKEVSSVTNNTDNDIVPIASSTANPNPLLKTVKKSKGRKKNKILQTQQKNSLEQIPENEPLLITHSTELETNQVHGNNHEQVSENITTEKSDTPKKTKRLRVKIKKHNSSNMSERSKSSHQEISSTVSQNLTSKSHNQSKSVAPKTCLVDWIKGMDCEKSLSNTKSQKSYVHMNLSSLDELSFTKFSDMDYAFYNTKDKFLGYMRFQPRQEKPFSRITQNLHLLIMSGEFNITTDGETGYSKAGDLVSVNSGCRYSVESLSDEVSVILFMKM